MFRMTLFFVIAGFFGRLLLTRDGVKAFIGNRVRRILLPLIVFWFVVLPPIVVAWIWAAYKVYGDQMPPPDPREGPEWLPLPLTHLWFLYILVWMYAGSLVVCEIGSWIDRSGRWRERLDQVVARLIQSYVAAPLLAAPTCVSLILLKNWPAWFGIPTPDRSLVPELTPMIAFATAFGFGWMLQRQVSVLKIWERQWAVHLAFALVTTGLCFSLMGVKPFYAPIAEEWRKVMYAICYTLGIWEWTFATFGLALVYCSDNSPRRRYLADSSYWVYLMHLPVVFLLQVAIQDAPGHWAIKFSFVFGMSMLILLASYHWLVRPTWIGRWLNGRSYPRVPVVPVACESQAVT
jgi:hypothetical protein